MKRALSVSLLLAVTTTPLPHAFAQSTSVGVDKVAYCQTARILGCNDITNPEYRAWEDAGVPDAAQKETWIARYNEPGRERTEHIVFLADGTRLQRDADPSLVTGQPGWQHRDGKFKWFVSQIQDASLTHQLFARGIYSRNNTFVGLGFDSRYRGAMSHDTLNSVVTAHYNWLKSKVDPTKLKSVYLAGHSRSGVLAIRLAKRFKEEFPKTIVIVDAFDPVARTWDCQVCVGWSDRDEIGVHTFLGSIDNPTVPYPRSTALFNNKGNWSWKTNLREQFPEKRNLFVSNYVNGGKMPREGLFNGSQDTRSFTLDTATSRLTDLGWYYQEWLPVPAESDGHLEIAQDAGLMSMAVDRLADRLDLALRNIAPAASISASSTWPGFNLTSVNDTDFDSREVGAFSWTNQNPPAGSSEWLQLTWPARIRTNLIEIISTEGKTPEGFTLQRLHDGVWSDIPGIRLSTQGTVITAAFDSIEADALRLTNLRGPTNEPQLFRVNEILVRGMSVGENTNLAPHAAASASSTYAGYSPAYANDGNQSTQLGAAYSWVNGGNDATPPVFQLTWQRPVRTSMLEVFSSDGYALQGYDIQYLSAATGTWLPVTSRIASRLDTYSVASFDPVVTTAIRLVNFIGPAHQPYYYRLNELAVYGTFADTLPQPVTLPPGVDPSPPELPPIPMPLKPLPTIGIPVMAY